LAQRKQRMMAAVTAQRQSERPHEFALTEPPPASPGDKTLTKGLRLLEALSARDGSRGISELAQQLSLTKSNVHRLLQTLSRCGYVMREAGTERYLLSSKLWQVSRRGGTFDALRGLVRPVLQNLVEETDESGVFVVVEHDDLVVIDQVETANPVRVAFFSAGQSFPIDRIVMTGKGLTALQLIALANRPEADACVALRKVQAQLKKPKSFVDAQRAVLAAIRKDGSAINRGEWVPGVNAAAVAVDDSSRKLTGIISCFGPADRLTERKIAAILKALAIGAGDMARRMNA
jgi:IclR family transcriptional regulator, KDG regulon repressor